MGISLSQSPTLQQPYTRWFYPGTDDPAAAGIVHLSDQPGKQQASFTLPDRQSSRPIKGTVYWPDGRVAKDARISIEDPRWPWQLGMSMVVAGEDGRFSLVALDGTDYRLYATVFEGGPFSSEPLPIPRGIGPLDVKLILTKKGYTRPDLGQAIEHWRKGLGLH